MHKAWHIASAMFSASRASAARGAARASGAGAAAAATATAAAAAASCRHGIAFSIRARPALAGGSSSGSSPSCSSGALPLTTPSIHTVRGRWAAMTWARAASSSSSSGDGAAAAAANNNDDDSSGGGKDGGSNRPAALTAAELVELLRGQLPAHCCGCGVKLQREAEDLPGFYRIPRKLLDFAAERALLLGLEEDAAGATSGREERRRRALDRAAEAWLDEQQRPADKPRGADGAADDDDDDDDGPGVDVLCERCFGLKHEGRVRRPGAEALLPDFDLGKRVGRKIALQRDRRAAVLVVVDVADFDGSLPRAALRALFPAIDAAPAPGAPPGAPPELPFTLLLAVNKFDLLPTQATPRRIEQWARLRLKQAGLPRPDAVFPVSAATGFGVREMVARLRDAMGFRCDLWVVGAQNAGKSSLINAMKRAGGTAGRGEPTVAPVPGTTLGLLRVPGMPLGPKQRAFDTPGVRHAYQLTTRLSALEDVAALLPRRRLKPRTWRVGAGSTLLVGGVARVDVVECPATTLYLTAYVSDDVVCHMGRTEGAEARRLRHAAGGEGGAAALVPPYSAAALAALGDLVPRDAAVDGSAWDKHSVDVAIAGLGWVAVGVVGRAKLRVWAPDGVAVTVRDAIVPDFAKDFQRPGWSDLLPGKSRAAKRAVFGGSSGGGSSGSAGGSSGEEDGDDGGAGSSSRVAEKQQQQQQQQQQQRAPRERGGTSSGGGGGRGRGSSSGRGGRGGGSGRGSGGRRGGGGGGGRGARSQSAAAGL